MIITAIGFQQVTVVLQQYRQCNKNNIKEQK
jgi:hypothetical protein